MQPSADEEERLYLLIHFLAVAHLGFELLLHWRQVRFVAPFLLRSLEYCDDGGDSDDDEKDNYCCCCHQHVKYLMAMDLMSGL